MFSVTGYPLKKLWLSYISTLIAGLESRGLTEPVDNYPCETSKIAIVWFCGTSDCTDAPILQNLRHEAGFNSTSFAFNTIFIPLNKAIIIGPDWLNDHNVCLLLMMDGHAA